MQWLGNDGSALIGSLVFVLVLSALGTVSLNLAHHEVEAVQAAREEATADNLATSGLEVVLASFHDPRLTQNAPVASLFAKRFDLPETGPSFFDAAGRSQFTGTAERPDLLLDASRPEDDWFLNDPQRGWFRSLRPLGRILKLKVYGPIRPGLLCTVEVTARAGGISRTGAAQLGARRIPPLRAAVQMRRGASSSPTALVSLQTLVHWGDTKIVGDVNLGRSDQLPLKTSLAPAGDQSYAEMVKPEDRWHDVWIGGQAVLTAVANQAPGLPANMHVQQIPSPGLSLDRWEYDSLKQQALLYGAYYVPDETGLLYRDGVIESDRGITATQALASADVGDHLGLVFIDTLDQRSPNGTNLVRLVLESEYSEGVFVINAHLHWNPKGTGRAVPALSPPPEDSSSLAARIPTRLSGIHLQGILDVAGDLTFAGAPRLFGGLLTEGEVTNTSGNPSKMEVWYNYDLRAGQVRGVPSVYLARGTWQERY